MAQLPKSPAAQLATLIQHKKEIEQMLFYGSTHPHTSASGNSFWKVAWTDESPKIEWLEDQFLPSFAEPMTREKAIAMNDGTWQQSS